MRAPALRVASYAGANLAATSILRLTGNPCAPHRCRAGATHDLRARLRCGPAKPRRGASARVVLCEGARRWDMKCQDIMSRNLETLTERDTIGRAARLMATTGVGFLPVCDADLRVIGVVTDRDL